MKQIGSVFKEFSEGLSEHCNSNSMSDCLIYTLHMFTFNYALAYHGHTSCKLPAYARKQEPETCALH